MHGPRDVVANAPGCPWGGWAPPDIRHCEENLCAWIAAPADTWSNAAYLAAALWLWSRGAAKGPVRWFAPAAAAVGVSSTLLHASNSFAFQLLDYAGMFLWVLLLLVLNMSRLGWVEDGRLGRVYGVLVAASSALLPAFRAAGVPVQPIVAVQVLAVAGTEAALFRRDGPAGYGPWAAGLGLTAAGFACWMLDYRRVHCDPANHVLQWHAAWHLLTALAFIPLRRFYAGRGAASADLRIREA